MSGFEAICSGCKRKLGSATPKVPRLDGRGFMCSDCALLQEHPAAALKPPQPTPLSAYELFDATEYMRERR